MSFPVQDASRVGQSTYWKFFGFNIVGCLFLLGGGVYAFLQGSWAIALLMILGVVPLGIYFRVIMMRRCRDIGWPAFVPWVSYGLTVVCGAMSGPTRTMAAAPSLASPILITGLIDFALMITIGCIASKGFSRDLASVFDDDPVPATPRRESRPVPSGFGEAPARPAVPTGFGGAMSMADRSADPESVDPVELDRWDAAIAARLRQGSDPVAPSIPAAPVRPVGGFGRRAV